MNLNQDLAQGFAIYMDGISKSFAYGKIKANQDITIKIKQNEIYALIGENGAGKSTLMSILFGLYKADKGDIYINGREVNFNSAKDASLMKLGMVHQHFKLVEAYSVWENIILGDEIKVVGILKIKAAKDKIKKLIQKYNFEININSKISKLSVGQQQKVEILKLLYREADILIFDEPTAVLSDVEIESFLQMLRDFKGQGKTCLIISHKLKEIKSVADRCAVIRLGKLVGEYSVSNLTIANMAELMVGHQLKVFDENKSVFGKEVVKVENLNMNHKWSFKNSNIFNKSNVNKNLINFSIHEGEIFAIAGVEGNGQSELVNLIAGLEKPNKNSVFFKGFHLESFIKIIFRKLFSDSTFSDKMIDVSEKNINFHYNKGMSFVPEDRHKYALFLNKSIRFNAISNDIDSKSYNTFGFFNKNNASLTTSKIIEKFDVRGAPWIDDSIRSLSGGNQQKFVVGREMNKKHDFIILTQPTRGLDIGAIEYIRSEILKEREKGNAILLISYELDEIYSIADTIAVMSDKKIIGIGPVSEMNRSKVGLMMANSNEGSN